MVKWSIWAVLAIFAAWSILDFLLHGVLLRSTYEATAPLWRPGNQINRPLVLLVTLVLIASFVLIYGLLVEPKCLTSGLRFGALVGLITGVASGFGTFLHMPIPLALAWSWFLGGWIKAFVAGALVGALMRPADPEA